jgi:hypothetical protein
MPQGKETSDDVKNEVRKLLFRDPDLRAKELKSEVEKTFLGLNLTERTYSNLKNELLPDVLKVKSSIMEREWSLGVLNVYNGMPPISPEAIPHINDIQKISKVYKLTVRQARWISYLYPLIKNKELLRGISFFYAHFEIIAEMSSKTFETKEYDEYLSNNQQKELLDIFMEMADSIDWQIQKTTLFKQTGFTKKEAITLVLLKGDKAFGIRKYESDVELGNRDYVYTFIKKQNLIAKKYSPTKDEIFLILKLPLIMEPAFEDKHKVPDMVIKDGKENG